MSELVIYILKTIEELRFYNVGVKGIKGFRIWQSYLKPRIKSGIFLRFTWLIGLFFFLWIMRGFYEKKKVKADLNGTNIATYSPAFFMSSHLFILRLPKLRQWHDVFQKCNFVQLFYWVRWRILLLAAVLKVVRLRKKSFWLIII